MNEAAAAAMTNPIEIFFFFILSVIMSHYSCGDLFLFWLQFFMCFEILWISLNFPKTLAVHVICFSATKASKWNLLIDFSSSSFFRQLLLPLFHLENLILLISFSMKRDTQTLSKEDLVCSWKHRERNTGWQWWIVSSVEELNPKKSFRVDCIIKPTTVTVFNLNIIWLSTDLAEREREFVFCFLLFSFFVSFEIIKIINNWAWSVETSLIVPHMLLFARVRIQ